MSARSQIQLQQTVLGLAKVANTKHKTVNHHCTWYEAQMFN